MGFDNDCILNIQSLAGEYFCPVCRLLIYPNEALQAPCNHLYCKPCLTYVVSTTHVCPYDGYPVTEADSKPLLESNKELADTIGKIQVHCLYYRTGCTWQGSLSDCTSHYSTCAYGESPVLCNRCGIQIVHRQVQEHAQNCPGVQSQAQQPGGVQDSTSAGTGAASEHSQSAAQTGTPASEAQKSQASVPVVSSQAAVANQTADSASQPQAAQAAMPTSEQWYQQQQQYQQQWQQYYQQYPVYDPSQQGYQQYYPQAVQQYQQQPMQAYASQAYGQAQPQVYGQAQAQTQPQLQAQQQVQPYAQPQPHQQPQVPSQGAQPPLQPQVQPVVNAHPQVASVGQAQSQTAAQGQAPPSHALPYNQPLPQAQPYAQPQPVPQQQMQVPQYPQTHPQMQHLQAQPYPPSQTQHYPHPQPQVQPQPHSQPNLQAPAYPPTQQPVHPSAQPQTPNAVTGYQSYPQPHQHSQAQAGVAQQVQVTGAQQQVQYPSQMQGQYPAQTAQMRPPQPHPNVPNQQSQPPSGPSAQQLPVYPHAQQPGYPFQQRPGVQAAQQAAPQYAQQQCFPGQGPLVHPQASMTSQLHAQGPSQLLQTQHNYAPAHGAQPTVAQNYSGRPMAQTAGGQPYAQVAGLAGMGQVRPPQPNQTYPTRTNTQLPLLADQQSAYLQRAASGEKPRDQMLEKGVHDNDGPTKQARDMAAASGAGSGVDQMKLKSEKGLNGSTDRNESNGDLAGSKQVPDTETKLVDNGVREGKPRIKADAAEGVSEPSPGGSAPKSGLEDSKDAHKKANVQELKHTAKSAGGASAPSSVLPQSHLVPQVHGTTFPYAPSAQHRPGAPSQPVNHPLNSQQPALLSHPPNQLRPHGPGQVPPGPPFNATDNSHPSKLKHPPGAITLDNQSGSIQGPGSSGPLGRPSNFGHYQGNFPPHLAGQPQNSQGDPFVGPSFGAQRGGAYDSRVAAAGREPMHHPDGEQRPPYPMEIEKFPALRSGYFDGRLPDSHPHGQMERIPYGAPSPGVQPGAMKFSGPLAHDSVPVLGMRDERINPFPEEHLRRFPHDDDLRKLPRPSHLEPGPSSKYGTQFPSSGPLDHGPHMFGGDRTSRPFDKGPHGFDRDPASKMDSAVPSGPSRFLPPFHPNDVGERARAFPEDEMRRADFSRRPEFPGQAPGPGFGGRRMDGLPPRSPGRDYPGFPTRTFGPYRDDGGNETRSFEGSKPYNFSAEPFGKSVHESRFPVPPRGDLDGNLRVGEHLVGGPHNQDMLPSHLRRGEHMGPRSLHTGEAMAFGPRGGLLPMGEPPLTGNFPQQIPFGDSFAGEKSGHPLVGEPGFRGGYGFQRYAHDGGFYPGEIEPFDNLRMRKAGSIMCRICRVECGTVEGLDLHSQSREHQRKARDMVLSIKQQNKKKQKISKDQASIDEGRDGGRPRVSNFQGRGNKR